MDEGRDDMGILQIVVVMRAEHIAGNCCRVPDELLKIIYNFQFTSGHVPGHSPGWECQSCSK